MMMHPYREALPESHRNVLLQESPIRANPTWAKWLDSQDPALEHVFFRDAALGRYATDLIAGTEFAADYLRRNYGASFEKLFGEPVHITDAAAKRRREVYNSEAQRQRHAAWVDAEIREREKANARAAAAAEKAAKRGGALL